MNEPQIRLKLSRFPGDKLIRIAVEVLGHRGVTTKGEAIDFLTQLVTENRKTLDEVLVLVQNAKPYVPLPEVQPDPRLDEALTNIQDRLHDLGKAVELKAQAAVEKAERDVHAKLAGVKSADSSLISETIRAEVAKVFAPFKQDASPEVLAEIAGRIGQFRTERAGDIFPVTAYGNVDFGDLQVGIWSDPEAPALVDDYVFNPAHLHQALIALDDQLPDNVWLAGERGTGKTEFVTQLAARLQRKLVRVNFDEALERADFIGANTISGGDVVWAEGIITKAIQHPGALVLLDEVGFARAQSISVLHALTERSVHRALTIAETGARIPVASHVAFFAADNSNGHGDGGNFAGVREQNSAFLDRFGFTLRFEYLPAQDEAALIVKRTGLTPRAAQILVDFAGAARQQASQGLLTQPPSLRQLFAWARAVAKGLPVDIAFKNAVINKFPSDCEAELTALYAAKVNEVELKEAL
jgi:nitric oxide reductase NorQ protein